MGTENTVGYTFKAANSVDVVAYFLGSTAAFDENLGLLVGGKDTGVAGLDNHPTPYGAALDFGPVKAGSKLTFDIHVNDFIAGDTPTYYSDASLNPGGHNQVYPSPTQASAGSRPVRTSPSRT